MDLLRSLPIGLYLEQPVTWLHRLDPRVKLAWLLTFLLTPIAASVYWRLSIVGWLMLLTMATAIPFRVWRRQMGLISVFSLLLFAITLAAPDGVPASHQPRLPANDLALVQSRSPSSPSSVSPSASPSTSSPASPASPSASPSVSPGVPSPSAAPSLDQTPTLPSPTDYRYILFQRGFFKITRRSLELAVRVSTLMFTLIYSTNLYLLTTAPEEITAGLDDLMRPLRRFGIPVTEVILTLTLSLRFIPLVLEEVQNLVRSIRTRAINWKKLGFRGTSQIWLMVSERLLDNLFVRAEQTALAMQVRGFTSPNRHDVKWHELRLKRSDILLLTVAIAFWGFRLVWG
ncbi:MAG TPA: CbiQ family ECF transporter T component [Chroococcidiopsis sp.]